MAPFAVISDALHRKSLAVTRSLGKNDIQLLVMSNSVFAPSIWSRYCTKKMFVSNDIFKSFSERDIWHIVSKTGDKPVFYAMEDSHIAWLSKNRKILSRYLRFAIPSEQSLGIAFSKLETMQFAKTLGIQVPETFSFSSPSEMNSFIEKDLPKFQNKGYLIKPETGNGSNGVIYLSVESFLKLDLQAHWNKYGNLLLQKRIPSNGDAIGVSILMDSGSLVSSFTHKRLNSYPNSGGPSTDRIGIHEPDLLTKSSELLKALNWHGIAMVEWKIDPDSKIAYLLEINPRFWGSLELAVRSGVDFPVMYFKLCVNSVQTTNSAHLINIRTRWVFPGEILRYLTQKKSERESIREFSKGLVKESEEWDRSDLKGSFASALLPFTMIFQPKYWHLLRR